MLLLLRIKNSSSIRRSSSMCKGMASAIRSGVTSSTATVTVISRDSETDKARRERVLWCRMSRGSTRGRGAAEGSAKHGHQPPGRSR